jgi:4-amino-4-deoxy-L-arabinose transferase-like glycosyltransferase
MEVILKKYFFSIVLCIIVLLAGGIRFIHITDTPPSLYWDEVAIGYNAYSIAQTGKDEFGKTFPLLFRSFNEYKSPGYIYLTVLPVMIFGLNEFSVRFGSAFLGAATVFVTYFLIIYLFAILKYDKKNKAVFLYKRRREIALLAAFLLAISPWHITFSRAGFEANAGLFFIVLGTTLMLKNIYDAKISFITTGICFALSFYFYRSLYVFTPLFMVGSIVIFREEIKRQIRNKFAWLGVIIFIIIFIPFLPSIFSKEGMVRSQTTSVNTIVIDDLNKAAIRRQQLGDPFWARIIFDRRVVYAQRVITDYLIHFSPKFLFIEGDTNARHRTIDYGELYLWEAPFLLFGLYVLFTISPKVRNFVILWILIAPLAASVTIPVPHALRTLNMLPMPQLLVAVGIVYLFSLIKLRQFRYAYVSIIAVIICIFFIRYISFYRYTTQVVSKEWGDGYKQLTHYVFSKEKKYDRIIVTGHYWEPYIYFLFYKHYDPTLYQCNGTKGHFDKYIFGGTSWDGGQELESVDLQTLAKTKNVLVALSPKEYTMQKSHIKKLSEIEDHAHTPIFIVGELR